MLQNTVNSQSYSPSFCVARNACVAIALAFLFCASPAYAQISSEHAPRPIVAQKQAPPSEQVPSAQIEFDSLLSKLTENWSPTSPESGQKSPSEPWTQGRLVVAKRFS